MFELTPGERRGALVLLALCVLGAAWDLAPRPAGTAPPAEALSPATALAPPAAPSAAGAGAATAVAPVDLNTADAAELDRLPGIGPVLAGRIVAHRSTHGPFRSPADLLAVPGIGPRLWERLRPLVRAGRVPARESLQIATPTEP